VKIELERKIQVVYEQVLEIDRLLKEKKLTRFY